MQLPKTYTLCLHRSPGSEQQQQQQQQQHLHVPWLLSVLGLFSSAQVQEKEFDNRCNSYQKLRYDKHDRHTATTHMVVCFVWLLTIHSLSSGHFRTWSGGTLAATWLNFAAKAISSHNVSGIEYSWFSDCLSLVFNLLCSLPGPLCAVDS